MEVEDGAIWVYGVGEDGVQAFTDFGIENLIELIRIYKENPELLKRWSRENPASLWPTPDGYVLHDLRGLEGEDQAINAADPSGGREGVCGFRRRHH
jgi:hypothetical protein